MRISLGFSAPRSLKARVTLVTLAIFMASIWSLYFHASATLRKDIAELVGEQQRATLSLLVPSMNNELAVRMKALEEAAKVGARYLSDRTALQAFLDQRAALPLLFNGGIIATDADGVAIAELPRAMGRIGTNYGKDQWVAAALKEGKNSIGHPVMGNLLRAPIFAMIVPVRDPAGKVVGSLGGVISLSKPNFLDEIADSHYGERGQFLVVAPRERLIVTANDKSRIMETLPARGVNPEIDRHLDSDELTNKVVNLHGEETLVSSQAIPISGWLVVAALPAKEAFAPIVTMQRRILLGAIVLTLLAGVLTWWMLRRQLSPMLATVQTLADLSGTDAPLRPLPIVRQDEVGQLVGAFNRLLEILAQREDALKKSEARLRELADAAFEGIAITEGGAFVDANAQFFSMVGYDRSELMGKPVLDVIAPESRELVAGKIAAGSLDTYENVLLRKDGSKVTVLSHAKYMPWQGRQARVTALIDITDLRRTEQALVRSYEEYRTLLETTTDGFCVVGVGGRLLDVNATYCRLTGYSREELLELPTVYELAAGKSREAIARGVAKIIEAGALRFEVQLRRKDGAVIDVEASVTRIAGTRRVLCFVRDVTERKRIERAHQHAQKLESLGTLAGGIAHDFNNILAAIQGNADLAAEDVGEDHPARESLTEIQKASTRASELVRRIMTFGRPQPTRREAVDLADVVGEVLKLLRSTLPTGIAFRTLFEHELPRVHADTSQVHEVVVNLTTNAAYAIGPRSGSITYQLGAVTLAEADCGRLNLLAGRYVRLTVSDSGAGMDEATMARIFDAFFTTKPVGEGTGLGLSMVYGIMQSHGGAVVVESAPGKGAHFHLYFPISNEAPASDAEAAADESIPAPGKRVLYVDDEEALVTLASRALVRLGHRVTGFHNPHSALAHFRAQSADFDIVVTDLSMPEMSGFDFARAVREIRPDMPIVMATGYIGAGDESAAQEQGIRELILKPTTMEQMAATLDRVLQGGESASTS